MTVDTERPPTVDGGPATDRDRAGFRADIQALRALAVLVVVIFHYWPGVLPGGYVGVDAFFVLSGFLITSHLLRELDSTGTVSLPRFWARRARRLLPASLTTLAITSALTMWFVPETLWSRFLGDARAATLYYVNWRLADDAVDYFAAGATASPVQHFWSLSTEEQYYLVWPALLFVVALVARGLNRRSSRTSIGVVISVVTVVSFVISIIMTSSSAGRAYYVSPTRAWEFGVGGLLSLVPAPRALTDGVRAAIAWGGAGTLVLAAFLLNENTAFPGWIAAWPVLATAAFILAQAECPTTSPMVIGRRRSVQFLGDASYSWYLWHWPVLVLAPFVVGRTLSAPELLAAALLSLALAAASLRFIERPTRSGRIARNHQPSVVLTVSAIAMVAVLVLAAGGLRRVEQLRTEASQQAPTVRDRCFGAGALADRSQCPINRQVPLDPSPLNALDDAVRPSCMVGNEVARLRICEFGAEPTEASTTIALIGDSHAGHFRSSIDALAKQNNWRVVTMLKGSCPFSGARRKTNSTNADSCEVWNRAVHDAIERRPSISIVFTSGSSLNEFRSTGTGTSFEAGVIGYREAWASLPESVELIVAIRDVPRPRPDNVDCLQALGSLERQIQPAACSRPRDEAILPDPLEVAAQTTDEERVVLVDFSDLICDERNCLTVVGNSVVYRDGHHLTATFAETLAPFLAEQMTAGSRAVTN